MISRTLRVWMGVAGLTLGLWAQSDDRQNPVWQEFGLEKVLSTQVGSTPVTAYQLKDSTGALAATQWLKSQNPPAQITQVGNYVVRWPSVPATDAVKQASTALPKVDRSSLPALPSYLPVRGLVAQSERYSLGEASLRQFEPRLPVSAVGFEKGAEVQLAQFRPKGSPEPVTLALILYPTPQMARLQTAELEKLSGAVVRRKSSLVSVVFSGNERAANLVLDDVRYQPVVVLNQRLPKTEPNVGVVMLEIFMLAGILIGASAVMGVLFGGWQIFRRKRGHVPGELVVLHLSDK